MKHTPALCCGALALLCASCSLKYATTYQDEANVPEFIFSDATFTKYEDDKQKLSLSAGALEQYSDGNSMYARDVEFTLLKTDGTVETEGSCTLLAADSKEEKYTLYDGIHIHNKKEDLEVTADTLRWNGKSEQLTSSRNDMVTIKKGKTTMIGSGFSASAVSKQFAFTGVISGTFDEDDAEGKNTLSENQDTEDVSADTEGDFADE